MATGGAVATLDSVSISAEGIPNETEKTAADNIVKKYVMDNCSVTDPQWNLVKGLILHGFAARSTSKKVTKTNDNWIKAKIGTSDITIGDAGLVAALNSATCLARFDNKPRAWARSNAKFYVEFFKQHEKKLTLTKGIEGGLQSKHAVASADFLVNGDGLDLEEQAALAQYRLRKLDSGPASTSNNPVNLFQLGSGR
jgi:hypothetical protein